MARKCEGSTYVSHALSHTLFLYTYYTRPHTHTFATRCEPWHNWSRSPSPFKKARGLFRLWRNRTNNNEKGGWEKTCFPLQFFYYLGHSCKHRRGGLDNAHTWETINTCTWIGKPIAPTPSPPPFVSQKEEKNLLSEPPVYLHTHIRMYLFIALTSSYILYCIVLYCLMHSVCR